MKLLISRLEGSRTIHSSSLDMDCHSDTGTVDGCKLSYTWIEQDKGLQEDWLKRVLVVSGKWEEISISPPVKLAIAIQLGDWSIDNYLLLPAAVYDGNRFEVRPIPYPPIFPKGEKKKTFPTTITDIPRLNLNTGKSQFDLLASDLSNPVICIYFPGTSRFLMFQFPVATRWGTTGISVQESLERDSVQLAISAPGVRHPNVYRICRQNERSQDKGIELNPFDEVELTIEIHEGPCESIEELYGAYQRLFFRNLPADPVPSTIPFSKSFSLIEAKHNDLNWEGEEGYYSVGLREKPGQDWQIGWVGGMMGTLPLLAEGSALSRRRACQTLDFALLRSLTMAHLPYGCRYNGRWGGDNFPHKTEWEEADSHFLLTRKAADALYFAFRHFAVLKNQDVSIKASWESAVRGMADRFVGTWKDNGEIGQFCDNRSGEILVGGSASSGILPAALVSAYSNFSDLSYLDAAQEIADYYYENFTAKGLTNGGPGEILQCPDSESAFGLLESYVALAEITNDGLWISRAESAAQQCLSWVVPYNFDFPADSCLGRLNIHSSGSVWANVQNKHSAPGICTLSGQSLWRLYRLTRNTDWIKLLQLIARGIPQYLSRENHVVYGMPPGWMNERVNLSDWEGKDFVGGGFRGSCWSEVSLLLTVHEIPGIYAVPDLGACFIFDHVEVSRKWHRPASEPGQRLGLSISNPTVFDAVVKIYSESMKSQNTPLPTDALHGCQRLEIHAGSSVDVVL